MKLITSNDINYDNVEVLAQAFSSNGLDSVYKEPEGFGNARVDVTFSSPTDDRDLEVVVMAWIPSGNPDHLKFRVVLFDRKERDKLKKNDELWKDINIRIEMINENAFGFLSLSNMVGITLDYCITIEGGITDLSLCSSVKKVAGTAKWAKSMILDEISFAD